MKTWLLLSCLTREYNFHRLSHRAEFPSVPQATFSRLLQPRIHVFGPHISTSLESGFTGHRLPCRHPTSKHPEQYPAGRMVSICSLTRGCVLEVHSEQGGGHLGILLGKEALGRKDFLSRFLPARHCQLSGRGPFCKSRGWIRHRPRRGENGAGYCHRAGLWVRVNVCWLSVPPQVQGQGCLWVLGP